MKNTLSLPAIPRRQFSFSVPNLCAITALACVLLTTFQPARANDGQNSSRQIPEIDPEAPPAGFNVPASPERNGDGPRQDPKQRENNLRRLMHSLGVDQAAVQNAIISYIESDVRARQPLRDATSKLFNAVKTPGVSDAQISVFVNEARGIIDNDKTRRTQAQDALKTKVAYDLTPRVEAMLLLMGLQGDTVMLPGNYGVVYQIEKERNGLRKELDGLKIEVDSLRKERDEARTKRDELKADNERLKRELDAAKQAGKAR